MNRPSIPNGTKNSILYANARRCCVCHRNRVQVHHIDQNPENNDPGNLAVLCLPCHDEAHTKHRLSQNLTPDQIKDHKQRWEAKVEENRSRGMLPEVVFGPAVWTYLNHERLPAVLSAFAVQYDPVLLQPFIEQKVVNTHGIPLPVIAPDNGPGEPVTIYDRIPFDCRAPLIEIYSQAIAKLILAANPIDLRELDSPDEVQALTQPGSLSFLHQGCYFRTEITREDCSQIRRASAPVAGVSVEFQVDTRLMFGNSAINGSFAGHPQVTALLLAKSVGPENGKTVLRCTPLAMGTGFLNRRTAWPGPSQK